MMIGVLYSFVSVSTRMFIVHNSKYYSTDVDDTSFVHLTVEHDNEEDQTDSVFRTMITILMLLRWTNVSKYAIDRHGKDCDLHHQRAY